MFGNQASLSFQCLTLTTTTITTERTQSNNLDFKDNVQFIYEMKVTTRQSSFLLFIFHVTVMCGR